MSAFQATTARDVDPVALRASEPWSAHVRLIDAPRVATDGQGPLHAFTVDVEDWYQSCVDYDAPITSRVVRNVDRVLTILDDHGVKGSFFVQGKVAETFPGLVRSLVELGHEVQAHGYSHRPLFAMNPAELRDELSRAKQTVEDAAGGGRHCFQPAGLLDPRRQSLGARDARGDGLRRRLVDLPDAVAALRHPRLATRPALHRIERLPDPRSAGGDQYLRTAPAARRRRRVLPVALSERTDVAAVCVVPPLYKNQTSAAAAWRYLRTFGPRATWSLTRRVVEARLRKQSFERTCERHAVLCKNVRDVNDPAFLEWLRPMGRT